jgi:hypothetical protein
VGNWSEGLWSSYRGIGLYKEIIEIARLRTEDRVDEDGVIESCLQYRPDEGSEEFKESLELNKAA